MKRNNMRRIKMSIRKCRKILLVLLISGILLTALGSFLVESLAYIVAGVFLITALAVFVLIGVLLFFFWACPSCKKPLPLNGEMFWDARHCPFCAKFLE